MTHLARAGVIAICAAVAPSAVWAQQQLPIVAPDTPVYHGLFGPSPTEQELNRRLFATFFVYQASDETSLDRALADRAVEPGRFSQGAEALLSFRRQRPRLKLTATGMSGLRYYPSLGEVRAAQQAGAVDATVDMTQHLHVDFMANGSYSPNYQVMPGMPFDIPSSASIQDPWVGRQRVLDYGGAVLMRYTQTRANEWQVSGEGSQEQVVGAPEFRSASARVLFLHRLSKDFTLRLGYGQTMAQRSDLPAQTYQTIDAGVNYNRSLELSPRTTIGFTTGSAISSLPEGPQFNIIASAFVKRLLSPRWTFDAWASHTLQSIPVTPRPYLTNGVSATLGGYFTRRLAVQLTPSYSFGSDLVQGSLRFHSFAAFGRFEVALNRLWAVYVEQFYYDYGFSAGTDLSAGVPQLTRRGARVGLTMWAPVVR